MRREKGKVPTDINKDNVATGSVKTPVQIKSEGSKTPQSFAAKRLQERGIEGKDNLDMKLASLQKERIKINPADLQKPKEFSKRIEHERAKDK